MIGPLKEGVHPHKKIRTRMGLECPTLVEIRKCDRGARRKVKGYWSRTDRPAEGEISCTPPLQGATTEFKGPVRKSTPS